MKQIIIVLVIFVLSIMQLNAQQRQDAIYLTVQPCDYGIGLRYDYMFGKVGMYNSLSYGNWSLYKEAGLEHHIKITIGSLLPVYNQHATVGLNYHSVQETILPDGYHKLSFELGFTAQIRNVVIGLRTDVLNWEPYVDIGIPISYQSRPMRKQYCRQ